MRIAAHLIVVTALVAAGSVERSRAQVQDAAPRITFTRDIAPLVLVHCASCHRPGAVGPFSLLTYRDARQHATQIAHVTSQHIMPPWKPVRESGRRFIGDRSLSDAEVALFQQWVAQGSVEGRAADLPALPAWPDGWQLGAPDLVVTMSTTYDVPAAAPSGDVFRTFVIPIPIGTAKYVRALEFRPDNARVVHHANLGVDRSGSSRRLDQQDPAPGYGGGMVPDASYPAGYMLGWTPGQSPRPSPDGMPWRLEPGSDLVVQVHLQPTGKPERLQVSAGLFFTETPPVRVPVGLRLGSQTLDIPAGASDYAVTDRYVLPVDVELLAVQPHAHNLGRTFSASALLPDGTTQPIVTITDWDFRWQDVYRYVRPLDLPRGTTLSVRITYDNSTSNPRNASRPPRRVVWGPNTSDEMGDLWLQLVPTRDADLPVLDADIARKSAADDLAAYTTLMRAEPGNPLRHDTVAMLYLKSGRVNEAIAEFRESLRLDRDSAPGHYNLGVALSMQQKVDEALAEYREAVRLDPSHADAHNNLATMLLLRGELAEATAHFQQSAALQSDNARAHDNLARALAASDRPVEALAEFQVAASLKPEWATPRAGAAWLRATSANPSVYDPVAAVREAERAAELSGQSDPMVLDALAASYAASGRFNDAVRTGQRALELTGQLPGSPLAAQIRARLALYQRGEAYREGP